MSEVSPVHREMIVKKSVSEVTAIIISRLQLLKGNIVRSDGTIIECDLGSLVKSRLLGEFFVSKSTLPKKAMISFKDAEGGDTQVTLDVRDAHKYGVKWGYVKKYEKALEGVADSILAPIE
ncbi:MAG: hypothetical protein WC901_04665 [Candidatus Margulisiibacteriota bacterium]